MKIQIDQAFAKGYCVQQDCSFLYQPPGKYTIQRKTKSFFCKKPELLKEHLEEHFMNGGNGAAKLIRGTEETFVLKSQAQHFVKIGRAEIIEEKPLAVKLKENTG